MEHSHAIPRDLKMNGNLKTVYWKGTRQPDILAYMNIQLRNTQTVIALNSQVGCYHNAHVGYINKYCTMMINYSKFAELRNG